MLIRNGVRSTPYEDWNIFPWKQQSKHIPRTSAVQLQPVVISIAMAIDRHSRRAGQGIHSSVSKSASLEQHPDRSLHTVQML